MVKRKSKKQDDSKVEISKNKFLSKEQLLTIKNVHLEREAVKKDILALHNKIECLDRDRTICTLQMSDLKSKSVVKDREHQEIIDEISRSIGVDLKDSVINQESGEVTFV